MKTRFLMVPAFLVVATMLCLTQQAQAGVLYSAAPDGTFTSGWRSILGGQQIVQEFTLGTGGTVEEISFYGFSEFGGDGASTGFVLEFFNDIAGAPSTTSFYSHTTAAAVGVDTGLVNGSGNGIHKWSFSVPFQGLAAGTQYWFGTKGISSSWIWSHSTSDGSGNVWFRNTDTNNWGVVGQNTRDNQAFDLLGSSNQQVPEPASLLIFSMIGLVACGRRRSS